MAVIEKKLNQSSLLQNFVSIIENDKKKKTPVIKFIRQGFLFSLAEKFKNTKKVHFIGITGESASGKSTFVRTVIKKIREVEADKNKSLLNFISCDNYFNDISAFIKKHGSFDKFLVEENYNPDAPESFKLKLMKEHFDKLSGFNDVMIPEYKIDGTGVSVENSILVKAAPIIISEGIAVFYPEVRNSFDIRFYVEVDEETREQRYIERAISKRNQSREDALLQYARINESAKIHLRPQRQYADVIINGKADISDIEEIAEKFSSCF